MELFCLSMRHTLAGMQCSARLLLLLLLLGFASALSDQLLSGYVALETCRETRTP
jgi:hypothetical protein